MASTTTAFHNKAIIMNQAAAPFKPPSVSFPRPLSILAGWHMDAFERRYDRKSVVRAQSRKASRVERMKPLGEGAADPDDAARMDCFRKANEMRRACERDVMDAHGGELPSSRHPILKLFVSKTRKARKGLLVGRDKALVGPCASKLLGLEERYVVMNEAMRGSIRIDMDSDFPSAEALVRALDACGAPHPNVVAFTPSPDGTIRRPHLLYLLFDSVCCTERGRGRAKSLLRKVEAGLVALLLPAGADPGGMCNPLRVKNPLSPDMGMLLVEGAAYQLSARNGKKSRQGLSALADLVPLNVGKASLLREAAAAAWGGSRRAGRVRSNRLFDELCALARTEVRRLRRPEGDTGSLEDLLEILLAHVLATTGKLCPRGRRTAEDVARWVWEHHDPARAAGRERPNAGLMRGTLDGLNETERKRAGQAFSARSKARASEDEVRLARESLRREGGAEPSVSALMRRTGLARNTVKAALGRLDERASELSAQTMIKRLVHRRDAGGDGEGKASKAPVRVGTRLHGPVLRRGRREAAAEGRPDREVREPLAVEGRRPGYPDSVRAPPQRPRGSGASSRDTGDAPPSPRRA